MQGRVWVPANERGRPSREEFAPATTSRSSATTRRVRRRSGSTSGGGSTRSSMAKAVAEAVSDDGLVTVKYADGTTRRGPAHAVREHDREGPWEGRLTAEGVIADPDRGFSGGVIGRGAVAPRIPGARYYRHRALPVEARKAAFVFGCTARMLVSSLTNLFWLILSQYVDDYPQAVKVLELLRWTPMRPGRAVVQRSAGSSRPRRNRQLREGDGGAVRGPGQVGEDHARGRHSRVLRSS